MKPLQCGPRASFFRRLTDANVYTEPAPLKYPWICGYFYSVAAACCSMRVVSRVKQHVAAASWRCCCRRSTGSDDAPLPPESVIVCDCDTMTLFHRSASSSSSPASLLSSSSSFRRRLPPSCNDDVDLLVLSAALHTMQLITLRIWFADLITLQMDAVTRLVTREYVRDLAIPTRQSLVSRL